MASRGELLRREIRGTPPSRHSMGSRFVETHALAERKFYPRRGPGNKKIRRVLKAGERQIREEIASTSEGTLIIAEGELIQEFELSIASNNSISLLPIS